jgi:hypothetical protein
MDRDRMHAQLPGGVSAAESRGQVNKKGGVMAKGKRVGKRHGKKHGKKRGK